MATMTRSISFATTRHHQFTTALLVLVFWIAASTLVATVHILLDVRSVPGSAVATIASIVAIAYAYMHLSARRRDVSHALGVGIAWLLLAIATEMLVTARIGHGWYALLGAPSHPLLRNLFLFVWIFAPAFFAQRGVIEGEHHS
jgi:hypothetical protein